MMRRFRNRWGFVLGLALGLVMAAGLAVAQEGAVSEPEEDTGPPTFEEGSFPPGNPAENPELGTDEGETGPPPFLREGFEGWSPGDSVGPPPWAGAEDGDPPPMLTEDWQPGTGIPPWVGDEEGDGGPPFLQEGAGDWSPGPDAGPPPWAGGKPPWADGSDDEADE